MCKFLIFIIVAFYMAHYVEKYLRKKVHLETDPGIYRKKSKQVALKNGSCTIHNIFIFPKLL